STVEGLSRISYCQDGDQFPPPDQGAVAEEGDHWGIVQTSDRVGSGDGSSLVVEEEGSGGDGVRTARDDRGKGIIGHAASDEEGVARTRRGRGELASGGSRLDPEPHLLPLLQGQRRRAARNEGTS